MRNVLNVCVVLLLTVSACAKASSYAPMEGDIIFHTSLSAQSLAVQRATKSKYSHMGIVTIRNGKPYVFEAVNPVKLTPIEQWIARGEKQKFSVKRLKDAQLVLSSDAIVKLQQIEKAFEGKPYDLAFAWSDERIYCSELVWKVYKRALGLEVGKLQHLKEFDLDDPAVKLKLSERYGKSVPLEETVISPASIYESDQLVTVTST